MCVALSADAAPRHVTGQAISDLVSGATVEIDTPMGTAMPVRFAADGSMSGEARELSSYLGSPTDTGRWWVTGDQLCHKWNRWLDAETHCLRLKLDGTRILWRRQDGTTGTATLTSRTEIARAAAPAPAARPRAVEPLAPAAASAPWPGDAADPDGTPPAMVERPAAPAAMMAGATTGIAASRTAKPAAEAPAVVAQRQTPSASVRVVTPAAVKTSVARRQADLPPPPQPSPMELDPDAIASDGLVMAVANVARNDVLNVRLGPSADDTIVGGIAPNGRNVVVTGPCRDQWCPVRHRDLAGWVNSRYLAGESLAALGNPELAAPAPRGRRERPAASDRGEAPRQCLTARARELLDRIETKFGLVKVVSTCRPGATIAGSGRISRHASGNAIDFDAGTRKALIVDWLVATHLDGGTMTYPDMDHIHVDIGPHFVSLAGPRMARR